MTHALAEAGLAPMRHYLIILDELGGRRSPGAGWSIAPQPHPSDLAGRGWVVMCSQTIEDLLSSSDEHGRSKPLA
jgi:hypothetical protein